MLRGARHRPHFHLLGAGSAAGRRQGIQGRPGGHDVIHQRHPGRQGRVDPEGIAQVGPPRAAIQAALAAGIAPPLGPTLRPNTSRSPSPGVATFCIALLPSYSAVGLLAHELVDVAVRRDDHADIDARGPDPTDAAKFS